MTKTKKITKTAAIKIGEMILNKYPDGVLNKIAKETIKKTYAQAGIGKPKGKSPSNSGINSQSKSGLSNKGNADKKGKVPTTDLRDKKNIKYKFLKKNS